MKGHSAGDKFVDNWAKENLVGRFIPKPRDRFGAKFLSYNRRALRTES